jgi:hypothetical protein
MGTGKKRRGLVLQSQQEQGGKQASDGDGKNVMQTHKNEN